MLSVIIPSRNGLLFTSQCLESVWQTFQGYDPTQIEYVLIDDDSDPNSGIVPLFQDFRQSVESKVEILRFKARQHFLGAINYGLLRSTQPFVLVLSNDMLLTPSFISTLLTVAAQIPQLGIIRGVSNHIDGYAEYKIVPPLPIRHYADALYFSDFVAHYYGLSFENHDWLLGADCVLITRSLIEKIGILDPRYFGYYGEIDYGVRTRLAGFQIVCALGAWIYHEGAGHIKEEATQGLGSYDENFQKRMIERSNLVQTAYAYFREKWDPSLPIQMPSQASVLKDFLTQGLTGFRADIPLFEDPGQLTWEEVLFL